MSVARALSIALAQRPAPRGGFHYSNTNYVVLGEVVERVTGRSYAREVRRRLILPLGLTGTRFPATPRAAGASGDLVSTLDDLNAFHTALLSGALLAPPQLRTMLDTRATGGVYGMGVLPTELPCGVTVWGHSRPDSRHLGPQRGRRRRHPGRHLPRGHRHTAPAGRGAATADGRVLPARHPPHPGRRTARPLLNPPRRPAAPPRTTPAGRCRARRGVPRRP